MYIRRTEVLIWLGCAVILLTSLCLFLMASYCLAGQIYGIDFTEDVFFTFVSLFWVGIALWGIATIFGLLRSRSWARSSALWFGRALFVIFLPEVGWYAYGVKTTPDVGWSWQPFYALIAFFGLGSLLIFLFSRTRISTSG